MRVSIIGSGNMAKGIASRLLSGKHEVTIHARDEAEAETLVQELQPNNESKSVTVTSIGHPADDIVIMATPYSEVESIATHYEGFKDKIIVDITNPVDFETFELLPEPGRSGAQEIAEKLPQAKVVKAFNTNLAGALLAGEIEGKSLDVFIAGDDGHSKQQISELISTSGMRPIDVGPLANARHLEGFGLIQMAIQDQIGTNWMSSLKFLG